MKRFALLIALIFFGMYLNAQEDNCLQLSDNWKTEKDAISRVENTTFATNDSVRPSDSWVSNASYRSCDDEFGYLIIRGEKKTFIHQNVPKAIWISLKDARSVGGYYNFYIKNKYKLEKKKSTSPVL